MADLGRGPIYTREQWGAKSWQKRAPFSVPASQRRGTVVHHNGPPMRLVGLTGDALTRREFELARGLQNYHLGLGWSDGAYSAYIGQSGAIFLLRGFDWDQFANGADVVGANDGPDRVWYTLMAMLGGDEKPSAAMIASIKWMIAEFRRRGAGDSVLPHNQFQVKACPGPELTVLCRELDAKPIDYDNEDDYMTLDQIINGWRDFNKGEAGAVRFVQDALRSIGFKPGRTDGKRGPRTDAAVQAFRRRILNQKNFTGNTLGPVAWRTLIALAAGYEAPASDEVDRAEYDALAARLAEAQRLAAQAASV
jgi:hypothetical protein